MFKMCVKHNERLDSKLQITNSNLISNNVCAKNEHKLITELINNLNQIKSHPQQKLNGKD